MYTAYIVWHSLLAFILLWRPVLALYLASFLTSHLESFPFFLTFYLTSILTFFLASILAFDFLHSIKAFYLAFYSDILFWHSIWHSFWPSFWPSFWHSFRNSVLAFYSGILYLTFYSGILSGIYSHVLSDTGTAGPQPQPLRSGVCSWGPAVPTEIWSLRLGGRKERRDGRRK